MVLMLFIGQTVHLHIPNLNNMEVLSRMQVRLLRLTLDIQRSEKFGMLILSFVLTHLWLLHSWFCWQGYYRRGAAYLAMGKFKEALKDFQQACFVLHSYYSFTLRALVHICAIYQANDATIISLIIMLLYVNTLVHSVVFWNVLHDNLIGTMFDCAFLS